MTRSQIDVGLSLEYFLSSMFGVSSTHGLAGCLSGKGSDRSWRKRFGRVINHLEEYIEFNVVTDVAHTNELQDAIGRLREANSARGPNSDRLVIAELVRLCLTLLGEMPNHWFDRRVVGNDCFSLNKVRSIHYSQSDAQKVELIKRFLKTRDTGNSREEFPPRDLVTKTLLAYHEKNRRYSHRLFLQWFKQEHPEDYIAVFCTP